MHPTLPSARLRGGATPRLRTTQTPARSGRGTGWLPAIRRLACWLALLLIGTGLSNAQDGSIDPTFNPTDVGFGNGDGASGTVNSVAVQSDGKILIVGGFTSYNGTERNGIARLNADGSLDTGFNPGTGASGFVSTVAVQSDGKILIGGNFTFYNGTARNGIARLNADGSLDTGFSPGTGANGSVYSVAVQGDGKILIGGAFTTYNDTGRNFIARLNTDGSLDTGFSPVRGPNNNVRSVAVQGDGKILVGGDFSTYNSISRSRIARLNADGSLDTGFSPGTGANSGSVVLSVVVQGDGKILIGGSFTAYNDTGRNFIARLNANGSLDTGFDPGTGASTFVASVAVQGDGKILIGGAFISYNGTSRNRIARLNADGSLDTGFDPGTGANNAVNSVVVQGDGKILIGGTFTAYNGTGRNRIARLNADGSLDAGFNPGTGANSGVLSVAMQGDGKILIGGGFTLYNGTGRNGIARLNADGTLDTGFDPGTGANNNVRGMAVQGDGKILIGGGFTTYNGTGRNRIARLNADGTLDTGFDPGTGANNTLNSVAVQGDGKILIGGGFTSYNGTGRNYIARLNADGSLDTGFDPGTGASSSVQSVAVQGDGKILIGGVFSSYNGTGRNYIARLNDDGTLDPTFNPGTGANNSVQSVVVQGDGRILIGGFFTQYSGMDRNYIARLNADGSLDAGFNPGTGASSSVRSVVVQGDGKILIGGEFTTFNGTGRNRIARLNTDGSLDTGFNPGTGASDIVNSVAVQTDNRILIGGDFTAYNGTGRNRIARLIASGALPVTLRYFNGRMTQAGALLGWATTREQNSSHFLIQRSGNALGFEVIANVPSGIPTGQSQTELTYSYTDTQPLPGVNYYRLVQVDGDGSRNPVGRIISLSREGQLSVLFPNPVGEAGEAKLEPALEYLRYELVDAGGRVVRQADKPGQMTNLSVHSLPTGVYLLRVQLPAGGQRTYRLLR